MSKTGCGFLPDKNMGLGIKSGVMFTSTDGSLMAGEASFEVIFNNHFGINTIGFYGYVEFAANVPALDNLQAAVTSCFKELVDKENDLVQGSLEKMRQVEKEKQENPSNAAKQTTGSEQKAANASIAASIGILYDFTSSTLHANFDFYVNAAGGILRGTASNNRAGYGVMHISPQKWYILLGVPDDRIGLQIGIPGVATVRADSYFMMGDDIPGSPPPPDKVVRFLSEKGENYNYMRDLNNLQAGRGIAFGSSLDFSTGDLTFLVLYARFDMGTGYDVMLKDYGAAQCSGRSGPIGINGWYANGQAYAYMMGELGVKVNLKIKKGRFALIKGGAAMLLQAKLPNPTWFGGSMGVKFEILGGLVKGNMKFKFSLGDECEILLPGTSPLDVSMISDVSPSAGAKEVDVFTAPQVTLTTAAGVPFEMTDEDGRKEYRISLNKCVVRDGQQELPGEIRWNREKTAATFYSHEILPPNKLLILEVAVGFEEFTSNRWSVVYTSGQRSEETRSIGFTTGDAPDYIPLHNVEYAYPVVGQQYYYPKEFTGGYVQLKRGQSYLFPTTGWKYSVQIDKPDKSLTNGFSYDAGNKKVNFALPALTRSEAYSIQFKCISDTYSSAEAPNQTRDVVLLDEGENTVVQKGTVANQVTRDGGGKTILEYGFNTSKYNTFKEKVNGMEKSHYQLERYSSYVVGMGWVMKYMPEEFEYMEVYGDEASANKPLIRAKGLMNDGFYKNTIYPLLYADYPPAAIRLDRDGDEVGIPPVYGFGKYIMSGEKKFPIRYELPKYYLSDFGELRNKIINAGLLTHPVAMAAYYPDILPGTYSTELQYVLPGGEEGTKVTFDYKVEK
jgi:hypothetical protein